MSFRGKFGFRVGSFDIGSFQPYKLVWGEGLGRSGRSLSFHDFRCYCKGCRDFGAELVENFESFFHGWDLRGQGYWREEFWLETIPDFKRGVPSGAMRSDIMGEFSKGK